MAFLGLAFMPGFCHGLRPVDVLFFGKPLYYPVPKTSSAVFSYGLPVWQDVDFILSQFSSCTCFWPFT